MPLIFLTGIMTIHLTFAKKPIALKLLLKKINTVRDLITFSIVFTYKNGMDRFDPPSK